MRSLLCLIFCLFSIAFTHAQSVEHQVIGATGAEIEQSNGSLYFTAGEPVSETLEADNYQLTQGYHQGLFLFVATENINKVPFDVSIYPNPAADHVNIELSGISSNGFEYSLYDLTGKQHLNGTFQNTIERLSLSSLANSTYFLKISNNKDGYHVTYQLQKTQ